VDRFLVLCGKLVMFNRNLVQHLDTWLGKVTPPCTEPSMKRCRLETSLDTELMASCYWLLSHCSRLHSIVSCAEIFPLLTTSEMEMRFIVIKY
jgi:predicted secreted protein